VCARVTCAVLVLISSSPVRSWSDRAIRCIRQGSWACKTVRSVAGGVMGWSAGAGDGAFRR
jgi:hypothetical protein